MSKEIRKIFKCCGNCEKCNKTAEECREEIRKILNILLKDYLKRIKKNKNTDLMYR